MMVTAPMAAAGLPLLGFLVAVGDCGQPTTIAATSATSATTCNLQTARGGMAPRHRSQRHRLRGGTRPEQAPQSPRGLGRGLPVRLAAPRT